MHTIHPYRVSTESSWVFDNPERRIRAEPLVRGASEMLTRIVQKKQIPNGDYAVTLLFSDQPIPGEDAVLTWANDEVGGSVYQSDLDDADGDRMTCWLCPALLLFFGSPPPQIHVRVEALAPGVNPIWEEGETPTLRFVTPPDGDIL